MLYWSVVKAVVLFGAYTCVLSTEMSRNMEGVHVGFLIQVIGQTAKWHRDRTRRSAAASRVIKEAGTQTMGTNNDKLQVTVAEWVVLKNILDIYGRQTFYEVEGRHREPWWQQTAARNNLSETLEEILAVARAQS